MKGGKKLFGLGIAATCVVLAGCVTMGRPLPESRRYPVEGALARSQDIPLVPVPPPPLNQANAPLAPATPPPSQASTPTPPAPPTPSQVSAPLPPPEAPPPESPIARTSGSTPAPPAATPGTTVRQMYESARERCGCTDSYIARMVRREVVKGEMSPEELLVFKFRKEPFSVYLKWLGKEGQGREVVYVKGQHESKIHTLLAAGDIPFVPAGRRMSLSPESPLVKSATRHPIYEAGMGFCVDKIGAALAAQERGDRRLGTLVVVGPVSRPEFEKPVLGIEHTLPAGADPSLPQGGRRTYFFDPEKNLPTLIVAQDEKGSEVEYYRYDRLQLGVKLDDADFDPDRLWVRPAAGTAPAR